MLFLENSIVLALFFMFYLYSYSLREQSSAQKALRIICNGRPSGPEPYAQNSKSYNKRGYSIFRDYVQVYTKL